MINQLIALLAIGAAAQGCSTDDSDNRNSRDGGIAEGPEQTLDVTDRGADYDREALRLKATLRALCLAAPASKTFHVATTDGDREYIVYSPKHDCDKAMPAVLVFHGGFGTADSAEDVSPFQAEADKSGSWIIYPNGMDRQWNDGRVKADGEPESTVDDVGFVHKILDQLALSQRVDMKRIYATGHSNGGTLSMRLACEVSKRIAAFATNAATLPESQSHTCKPSRPVPLLMVNGTDDTFMPYDGGAGRFLEGERLSVDETAELFATLSSCTKAVEEIDLPNLDRRDGATSTRYVRSPCKSRVEVQNIKITGGGHTWPGSAGSRIPWLRTGNLTMDFSMSAEAMKFFRRFTLP